MASPWFGRSVYVHSVIDKPGDAVFRCNLTGLRSDRLLEVPIWMFDRTACASCRRSGFAHVGLEALRALAGLVSDAACIPLGAVRRMRTRLCKDSAAVPYPAPSSRPSARATAPCLTPHFQSAPAGSVHWTHATDHRAWSSCPAWSAARRSREAMCTPPPGWPR